MNIITQRKRNSTRAYYNRCVFWLNKTNQITHVIDYFCGHELFRKKLPIKSLLCGYGTQLLYGKKYDVLLCKDMCILESMLWTFIAYALVVGR
jgi:hypothetical protein